MSEADFWLSLEYRVCRELGGMSKTRRKSSRSRPREVLQKPTGVIHARVQKVGPDHFGIVSVDCAKARSKWMLADFYGRKIKTTLRTIIHMEGAVTRTLVCIFAKRPRAFAKTLRSQAACTTVVTPGVG